MKHGWIFMIGLLLTGQLVNADENVISRELALRLNQERDWRGSAIEFRRLGMTVEAAEQQAGYFWAAGYQYLRTGQYPVADAMVNTAEDRHVSLEDRALLLRGEIAASRKDWAEAAFYWSTLMRGATDESQETLARRRLAAIRMREGNVSTARQLLEASPVKEQSAIEHIERYAAGQDKSPRLGGLLGIIPGMGYAYAGEYANAIRSLILNSLFIYGMIDTASNDHWGGFAVITFFEITWFTGSIYGGIDASHRHNERRLNDVIDEIERDTRFEPVWEELPTVSIRYQF